MPQLITESNRVQVKTMTVGSTSTEYLSQLKFNNLKVGVAYRITYNLRFRSSGISDSGVQITAYNDNNAANNPVLSMYCQAASGLNEDTLSASKIFVAVNSVLSLRHVDSLSGEIVTDSVSNYAVLEELSIATTTDFT